MLSKEAESFLMKLRITLMERGKDDQSINEIEDELRDHLTEAEAHGHSVDDVTGGSVEHYINQISQEVPKDHKWKRLIAMIVGILFIITILPDFFSGSFALTLGKLIHFIIVLATGIISWKLIKYYVVKWGSVLNPDDPLPAKFYIFSVINGIVIMAVLLGSVFLSKHFKLYTFMVLSPKTSFITGCFIALLGIIIAAVFKYWQLALVIIIVVLPSIITQAIYGTTQSKAAATTDAWLTLSCFLLFMIISFIYI
ncbi:hypothetical protein MUA90_02360 [Staphylococcus sp. IVB6181]|uniref:hypothetical protein n=1 Tax=Staphylococcus sp. IVB6181 TaxID=2929481 RepID=UPI0021CE0C80|nr:hypothetical protein [Staphylococcus sp. IVB6181]UXV35387.1 hypothetical protein MUA90_02360 [Staphylococcus sp. IVB6181]